MTRGKGKLIENFPTSKKTFVDKLSRISLRGKKSIAIENFPLRERERKVYILRIYVFPFPACHGGKKGGLTLRPPSFLPLSMTKKFSTTQKAIVK